MFDVYSCEERDFQYQCETIELISNLRSKNEEELKNHYNTMKENGELEENKYTDDIENIVKQPKWTEKQKRFVINHIINS